MASDLILLGEADRVSVAFDLPTLIESRLLVQANSGGGKSYLIRRLLEQSHGKLQQIVIDLEGEFLTLREKFGYVHAGKDGDTPVQPKTAGLLARRLMEIGVSAICDMSELQKHERPRFVKLFIESLIEAPKSLRHPVMIVIDECHHFCPEKGQAESATAVIDLCTRGRKRGLLPVLATQRISKLSKDACAETLNRLIGRTGLDIDMQRAGDELGMNKADRTKLRNLRPGDFFVFGPALRLDRGVFAGVSAVRIGPVQTKHPKVGSRDIAAPPVITDGVKSALAKLADLPGEADREAKDVDALRRDNTELRRKLTLAEKGHPAPCNHEETILMLKEETNQALLGRNQEANAAAFYATHRNGVIVRVQKSIEEVRAVLNQLFAFTQQEMGEKPPAAAFSVSTTTSTGPSPDKWGPRRLAPLEREPDQDRGRALAGGANVSGPQQRLLNTLSMFESIGFTEVVKESLAAVAGVSSLSSAYGNNLGALRTAGLIEYPRSGCVALTSHGRSVAQHQDTPLSLQSLHEAWVNMLSRPQVSILQKLITLYPKDIDKESLAEAVGVSALSSAYGNNLGRLRTLGAIIYPCSGRVCASHLLFPEGLK